MKQCKTCNIEIEQDKTLCHPCYLKSKNFRMIESNEIIFDVDDRKKGFEAINFIAINLYNSDYNFEIYYAKGQKSPHLHVKEILDLQDLTSEQLKKYKEEFIRKFTPEEFLEFTDLSICCNHAIAEENKPHFKYGTIKKLCGVFNENNLNDVDEEIYNKVLKIPNKNYKPDIKGTGITAQITRQISIIDIAEQFGLSVKKNKALCPFHPDGKTPSLVFYENQGRVHCFGCNFDGNIIYFYACLKQLNQNFVYSK